jgi:hypothetical protein
VVKHTPPDWQSVGEKAGPQKIEVLRGKTMSLIGKSMGEQQIHRNNGGVAW